MESKAIVHIPLDELEALKLSIVQKDEEISRLKNLTEATITIDGDIYSWTEPEINRQFAYRVRAWGSLDLAKPDDTWQQFQETLEEVFEKILEKSLPLKFYRKFPNWVHKLFGCEQK